jgi:hypothetical protein
MCAIYPSRNFLMKAFDLTTNKRGLARGLLLLHLVPVLRYHAGIGLLHGKGGRGSHQSRVEIIDWQTNPERLVNHNSLITPQMQK